MPQKAATTHVLMSNELVLYQREHSNVWQCRYKVDGVWQRATTKLRDLGKAKVQAKELMMEAEIRRRSNLPFITRKFRHVAKLAIDRMEQDALAGRGKVSFADYIRVTSDFLIPFFGNYSITSIDYALLDEFDIWRTENMRRLPDGTQRTPTRSTLLTHNAALNRVFDEAVVRGFLTDANRLKLEAKGKASDRRPAFDLNEIHAMFALAPQPLLERGEDGAEGLRVGQHRRDVLEEDSRLGKVGHVADQGAGAFEGLLLGCHARSYQSGREKPKPQTKDSRRSQGGDGTDGRSRSAFGDAARGDG